jgi:hypothetical protein
METKGFFQSKTVWFNIIITVIGAAGAISAPDIADLGLSAVASAWVLKICGTLAFLGNIYLRTVTASAVTTPLTKKPQYGNE